MLEGEIILRLNPCPNDQQKTEKGVIYQRRAGQARKQYTKIG